MARARAAIVTGASKGIGQAIATRLAESGYGLLLVARSGGRLNEICRELSSRHGVEAHGRPTDLRDPAAAKDVIEAANLHLGSVDLLVNNAGAAKAGDFFSLSHEDFVDGFALKFHAAVSLVRAAWPHLKAAGNGQVINIVGIGGRIPSPDFAIGGAVNSALMNFTKAMATLGLRDGIRVNAINPGAIETDRLTTWISRLMSDRHLSRDEARASLAQELKITRFGRPEEVAALVAYLDSVEGSYFHGAILDLDGGAVKEL